VRGEWIGKRENVLALGNSGTGKARIGLALGLAARQRGRRVRFTTAASLVHDCSRNPLLEKTLSAGGVGWPMVAG